MNINTLPDGGLSLGAFLRERRERLAPDADAGARRRTPGLRREEVAGRAGVSVTWYTWLEQGRGGPPSDEALERLARALELDAANREILFLLARHRPPPVRVAESEALPEGLQDVLDAFGSSPALVKRPSWDVVAWNRAARLVLADYDALPAGERNVLKRIFAQVPTDPEAFADWEANARFAIAVLRMDMARAGGDERASAVIGELRAGSEPFRRLWAENDVQTHGMHRKRVRHPTAGPIRFRSTGFAVDGAPSLTMIVLLPEGEVDRLRLDRLLAAAGAS